MGARLLMNSSSITSEGSKLQCTVVDIDSTPDLMPVLSVAAMAASGKTKFINAARQQFKESDRIISIEKMASSLQCQVRSTPNSLIITGNSVIKGGSIDSFGDHRIVMAATVASCLADSPITVIKAESISKSYPSFFEDFKSLGGIVDVI